MGALALNLAVISGHLETVKFLVNNYEVDVNRADEPLKITALHDAVNNGKSLEIVEFLIAKDANVNQANYYGWTPLYYAAESRNTNIMNILIKNEADITQVKVIANKERKEKVIDFINSLSPCFKTESSTIQKSYNVTENITKLIDAIKKKNIPSIKEILKPLTDGTTKNTHTDLLHTTNISSDVKIGIKIDIEEADSSGNLPLYYAAREGDIEIIKLLIAAGANIDKPVNERGEHAIHSAVMSGYVTAVAFLVNEYGIDVNKTNYEGYTPLCKAAEQDKNEAIQCLISLGADIEKANSLGYTPLYAAAKYGNIDVMKILITAGADTKKVIFLAKKEQDKLPLNFLVIAITNIKEKQDAQNIATE